MPLLSLIVFAPIIGALVVYLAGFKSDRLSKALTIIIAASTIVATLFISMTFDGTSTGFQFVEKYDWAPIFGLTYTLGIDGISLPFLLISSLLTTLSAAGSWEQIKTKVKEYNALLLLFEGSIIGVFTSPKPGSSRIVRVPMCS